MLISDLHSMLLNGNSNTSKFSKYLLGFVALLFVAVGCDSGPKVPKNNWPQEFYLPKKACYTRYFYENVVNKNQEYELYCNDHTTLTLTRTADSVCYDDGIEGECLSENDFITKYGKPEELTRIDPHKLSFVLDTVRDWNKVLDSNNTDSQNHGITVALKVGLEGKNIYTKKYNCSRVKLFDPGLILVYRAESKDSIYFVDGEPNCLVLEMEYYDEEGVFGGWEQFSTDIKALRVVD